MEGITEYQEVDRWLYGRSKNTVKNYSSDLGQYCVFRKMNPQELIDEIEEDRKKTRRERGLPEYRLKEFIEKLKGEEKSEHTIARSVVAIKSFYKSNGYPLLVRTPTAKTKTLKKSITAKDVLRLVEVVPHFREKSLITFLFQSGMPISDVLDLRYRDVKDELEQEKNPLLLNVSRGKINKRYQTFIGSDAIYFLKLYLNERKKKSEVLTEDSYIFASNTKNNRPISHREASRIIRTAAIKSGLVNEDEIKRNGGLSPVRPHTLRSGFSTLLQLDGVQKILVEFWMGHKLDYDAAYLIPPEEKQREEYSQHGVVLSLHETVDVAEVKSDMEERLQDMEATLIRYKKVVENQQEEIRELKEELSELGKIERLWDSLSKIMNEENKKEKFLEMLGIE